jgi:hypothetical protein
MWGLRAYGYIQDKLEFTKKGFRVKNLLRFLCWRYYRHVSYREVKHFIIRFYIPWFYYDVSIHEVVEIVIVILTRISWSKSKSRCISYRNFHTGLSAVFPGLLVSGVLPEMIAKLLL